MYACMYVCMYVCMYECVFEYMHVCIVMFKKGCLHCVVFILIVFFYKFADLQTFLVYKSGLLTILFCKSCLLTTLCLPKLFVDNSLFTKVVC